MVLFSLVWTTVMILLKSMEHGGPTWEIVFHEALFGLFMGFFYSLIIRYSSGRTYKEVNIELDKEEALIKDGGANRWTGNNPEGGRLVLTDRRLIFRAQQYNTQYYQLSFELQELCNIQVTKSWLLLKNELRFEVADGTLFRFAVDNPNRWLHAIHNQLPAASTV